MKRTHGFISRGFTLIEVMIAMLVLSLGMLGIAATLIAALHSSSSNYLSQQAVQSTYDILDRMRSNFNQASIAGTANPYITAATKPSGSAPTPDCTAATTCTNANMAAYDVWQWQTNLQNSLPGGLGSIAVTGVGPASQTAQVVITVTWSDQPAQATFNPTGPATQTYTVVTQL